MHIPLRTAPPRQMTIGMGDVWYAAGGSREQQGGHQEQAAHFSVGGAALMAL